MVVRNISEDILRHEIVRLTTSTSYKIENMVSLLRSILSQPKGDETIEKVFLNEKSERTKRILKGCLEIATEYHQSVPRTDGKVVHLSLIALPLLIEVETKNSFKYLNLYLDSTKSIGESLKAAKVEISGDMSLIALKTLYTYESLKELKLTEVSALSKYMASYKTPGTVEALEALLGPARNLSQAEQPPSKGGRHTLLRFVILTLTEVRKKDELTSDLNRGLWGERSIDLSNKLHDFNRIYSGKVIKELQSDFQEPYVRICGAEVVLDGIYRFSDGLATGILNGSARQMLDFVMTLNETPTQCGYSQENEVVTFSFETPFGKIHKKVILPGLTEAERSDQMSSVLVELEGLGVTANDSTDFAPTHRWAC